MAVTNEQIARINELARKAKTTGLTPEEEAERKALRAAYVEAFRESLCSQLDATVVVRPDGSREPLRRKS